jgi:hypothetical protein
LLYFFCTANIRGGFGGKKSGFGGFGGVDYLLNLSSKILIKGTFG